MNDGIDAALVGMVTESALALAKLKLGLVVGSVVLMVLMVLMVLATT